MLPGIAAGAHLIGGPDKTAAIQKLYLRRADQSPSDERFTGTFGTTGSTESRQSNRIEGTRTNRELASVV